MQQMSLDMVYKTKSPHVVIAYKNRPLVDGVSHIGLGVSALNTSKSLNSSGVSSDVWAISGTKSIADQLKSYSPRPTHVVISAPWLPSAELRTVIFANPDVRFAVTCHSNVGFLQADPQAISNFREMLDLEQGSLNFSAAGNSQRFCSWIAAAYSRPCIWLPNLYFLDTAHPVYRHPWSGKHLKIGSFGAVRPLKNHLSSAAAALEMHNDLHATVEFHISVGRIEGGSTVVRSLRALLGNTPGVTLVEDPWYTWPEFRRLVRSMDLLMQPSYTETFNMVTADAVAEGVPAVASDAIDWAPDSWKADVDDALSVARVAKSLLTNMHAAAEGFNALSSHNQKGVQAWHSWVSGSTQMAKRVA